MSADRRHDSSGRREPAHNRLFDVAMTRATTEDEQAPELDERARARILLRVLHED